jgi:hypothetical protein
MSTAPDTAFLKGRAVSRLLEVMGWITAVLGIMLMALGLWSMVSPPQAFAASGLAGSALLTALGIVIGIAGLIGVQIALTARATFRMAQDIRALQSPAARPAAPAAAAAAPATPAPHPGRRAEPSLTRPVPR